MADDRSVTLRAEHDGRDHRYLTARFTDTGDLRLDGQDLGPKAPEGEYEWVRTVPVDQLPDLLSALGAAPDVDVLDELETSWSGRASYDLERVLRDTGLGRLYVL